MFPRHSKERIARVKQISGLQWWRLLLSCCRFRCWCIRWTLDGNRAALCYMGLRKPSRIDSRFVDALVEKILVNWMHEGEAVREETGKRAVSA